MRCVNAFARYDLGESTFWLKQPSPGIAAVNDVRGLFPPEVNAQAKVIWRTLHEIKGREPQDALRGYGALLDTWSC